ncbi:hypothetical protein [Leptothermofonsia sp. ETS-13]|uniref:hypothetical protein n=1 Tax=Leptothermofonsia sp. ETS-13 TaxID=3035696 RepID=UPI003BA023C0
MSQTAERITRLCHAYIKLSDKFQKLDVEYMTLRGKVVPLIKALKTYKQLVEQLSQEKQTLEEKLQETTLKYEELKPLEILLQSEFHEALSEAEEQVELVEATLHEMESDRDPDLSDIDKELLIQYQNDPEQFNLLLNAPFLNQSESCLTSEKMLQSI